MIRIIILNIILLYSLTLNANECLDKGREYYKAGKHNKSISVLKKCLSDIENINDKGLLGDAYNGIGMNYYSIGELDSSLKYLLIAESIFNQVGDKTPLAKVLNDISACYINKGLNQYALYYLKQSVEINKSLDSRTRLLKNYNNLGHANYNLNQIDSSLTYFKLALKYADEDDIVNICSIWNNLGILYFKKEDFKSSSIYFQKIFDSQIHDINYKKSIFYYTNFDLINVIKFGVFKYEEKISQYTGINDLTPFEEADREFKMSIYNLMNHNINDSKNNLNKSISIHLANQNYSKAIEVAEFYKLFSNNFKLSSIDIIESKISSLRKKEAELYSKNLQNELNLRKEIEDSLIEMNKEVEFAWASFEFLSFILIILILFIPITFKYIVTNKLLNSLRLRIEQQTLLLQSYHNSRIKNQIAKIINIMLLSKNYEDNDILIIEVDSLTENSNEFSELINSLNNNRSKYVNTNSPNELFLD